MRIERGEAIFSDGTIVYASNGVIGIDSDGDLYGGYDQELRYHNRWGGCLANKHVIELCEYMIAAWQERLKQAVALETENK